MEKLYLLVEYYPVTASLCTNPVIVSSRGVASKDIEELKRMANTLRSVALRWDKVDGDFISHELEPNRWFEIQELKII